MTGVVPAPGVSSGTGVVPVPGVVAGPVFGVVPVLGVVPAPVPLPVGPAHGRATAPRSAAPGAASVAST
ncbi:MAG: hypothetical protein L0I76_25795, partial [Pseudonocardia sp.]|nr:hypothetical protein [Pseudonocardia sp.]